MSENTPFIGQDENAKTTLAREVARLSEDDAKLLLEHIEDEMINGVTVSKAESRPLSATVSELLDLSRKSQCLLSDVACTINVCVTVLLEHSTTPNIVDSVANALDLLHSTINKDTQNGDIEVALYGLARRLETEGASNAE